MLIAYDSLTGNVKRFITKVSKDSPSLKVVNVNDNPIINEKFILVTYTIGFGNVPATTEKFLNENHKNLIAVASSGNLVWGNNFGKSGDIISQQYGVPLIIKFELSGTTKDVEKFTQEVIGIDNNS